MMNIVYPRHSDVCHMKEEVNTKIAMLSFKIRLPRPTPISCHTHILCVSKPIF